MKFAVSVFLLAVTLMSSACVSRTVTSEKGFGDEVTEKRIIWIWEKEFRDPK